MGKSQNATVIERLKQALGAASLDGVAQKLGESRGAVGSWSSRGSVPLDALVRATEVANCSLDWLVFGQEKSHLATQSERGGYAVQGAFSAVAHVATDGPAPWLLDRPDAAADARSGGASGKSDIEGKRPAALLRSRGAGAVLPLVLSVPEGEQGGPSEDYEVIPKHVRSALAGSGGAGATDAGDAVNLIGEMAFSFDWMKRNLGHTTGVLTSIQVRGDSMAATLLDGETIVIDEGVDGVEVDGIYVLDVYGRRLVKRVQHLVDGTLVLISDNPSYQRETIPRDRARDVRVIGRMVWPRVR